MDIKIIPVTALRPHLLAYIGRAHKTGQEYIITKNGKPSAVIIGFEEWESLKETAEILSDPATMRRIHRSKAYFRRGGRGKSIDELFK